MALFRISTFQYSLPFLFCFSSFILLYPVESDVFSAVDKLIALFKLEETFLDEIKRFIRLEDKQGRQLEDDWMQVYEKLKSQHSKDNKRINFTENPIDCYHFLRRFTTNLQPLLDHIICEECEDYMKKNTFKISKLVRESQKTGVWPSEQDFRGAAASLVRLSDVYRLDLEELFNGKIMNTQTLPLTDDELFHIVKTVEEKDLNYQCIKWLEAGLKRALGRRDHSKAIRFYKFMATVYMGEKLVWKSLEIIEEGIKMFPRNKGLIRDLDFFKDRASKIPEEKRLKKLARKPQSALMQKYEALCRGREGPYNNGLCRYKKTRIPIYLAKEEILSVDPRIGMFHEVIFEKEMEHIKKVAIEKLFRSSIINEQNPISDIRISQSAWLRDDKSEVIHTLTKRIELITGMSLTERSYSSDSESLQVLNYGIGGMYEPHYDFFNASYLPIPNEIKMLRNSGDRVATWLFYLNDVKAGGSTVFPKVNVRVPVVKGSAAFWYNLKRHSWGDNRTKHAGCPVLLGSKWVCNKWIRYNGNIFNTPCGLKYNSTYDL